MSLCISAMLGENVDIKNVFEKISMNNVKEWKKNNIGDTLLKQKRNLLKKTG